MEVTGAHSTTSLSMTATSHRKPDLLGQPVTAVVFKDTISTLCTGFYLKTQMTFCYQSEFTLSFIT